jgi:3-dehydroquinate synthase
LVSGYRVSHGNAVAVGLRAAGLLALRTGRFSATEHLRVLSLLALLRLPMIAPVADAGAVLAAMGGDKKTREGKPRFVVPRALGDVEFGVSVPPRTVRAVLGRLREAPGVAEFR